MIVKLLRNAQNTLFSLVCAAGTDVRSFATRQVGTVFETFSSHRQVIYERIILGHSNLNSTLKIIGKHPNGQCEQCYVEETATVILECSI